MPVQKAVSNSDATASRDEPAPPKTNCDDGDDAIAVSVLKDTVPKPTAKIEMPAAFTVFATVTGLAPRVFSPSLSNTMARGWLVAEIR